MLRRLGADWRTAGLLGAHPAVRIESWFWRLTEPDAVRLLAATLCRDDRGERWGLVCLADDGGDVRTAVVDAPRAAEDGLRLEWGDVLTASRDRIEARVDGRELVRDLGDARRWDPPLLGGLGLGHLVPRLTQYWHPHLLGRAVYAEHVWGRGGVPEAWWWGQGAPDEGVVACFAGGVLQVGPARVGATALVVRVGDEVIAISPGLGVVGASVGADGWLVRGQTHEHRVSIEGEAAGVPITQPVPVPGTRRTAPISHQHQDGVLRLVVRRGRRLVFRGEARRAGLEQGGTAGR